MKSAEAIAQHLQEIITNIYLHPAMYGETVAEVDLALWIYHGMWTYLTEKRAEFLRALEDAHEAVGCGSVSFHHAYRRIHPGAPDNEVLKFALKHWATVTADLGIPLPADYPDPRHSFLPNIAQGSRI